MRVFYWPEHKSIPLRETAATVGMFDGVHRGHRAVIETVVSEGRARSLPSIVITFDRHPDQVIADVERPAITSCAHRLRLFERLGADNCLLIRFTRDVAGMEPEAFVREVLCELLGVRLLVLGFNFRFGRGGRGDVKLCSRIGSGLGFDVISVPAVEVCGEVVSSTAIRCAVQGGEFKRAERLLGRPCSVLGTVVPGGGRGMRLGYPTANLDLHNELMPPDGVYAARVLFGGQEWPAAASVGRRETFHHEADAARVVEAHLLDTSVELYGQDLEVTFVELIRPQRDFASEDALRDAIRQDVAKVREVLAGGHDRDPT